MDTAQILADLRAQRNRIDDAITALEALNGTKPLGKPAATLDVNQASPTVRRTMSPAARKKIAAALKARWAAKKNVRQACCRCEASCHEEGCGQDGQACDQPREPQEDGRGAAEALGEEEESSEGRREKGSCGSGCHSRRKGNTEGVAGIFGRCFSSTSHQ